MFNSILPYGRKSLAQYKTVADPAEPEFIDLETKVQEVLFKAGHVVSAK